ncbi:alpha/beta hydrolase [Agrobacterium vitis]|uniref:Alpha/beta hydrolase n=1 Tax=Agrobacterium vitis TaxID=373 RepID=A0AAE2UVU1_AGRVI|nr:alpha/beta hydrolase-fold protein [Agrobacterium vitis]MBF2714349.1 alpha/beta hydrolase [Agrobacterium vitis]MVA22011.1 alpha/beta hydrolase [Agrobacterium vitis]
MPDNQLEKTWAGVGTGHDLPEVTSISLAPQPLVMPGCRRFPMRSLETDLEYEIFVYVPDIEPPASGFPVIYCLDANSDFITVAETVRRVSRRPKATGIAPSIVVGIGYPNTNGYNVDRRHRDFTANSADPDVFADYPRDCCGGQAAFIRFLGHQLRSHIQSSLNADAHRRILLGHSLAGYFVLDLLAKYPDMFDGYISFSPSIWWDRPGLSQTLTSARAIAKPIRLYTAVGRWEQELAPWQDSKNFSSQYDEIRKVRRMIDNTRQISSEISTTFGAMANVQFEIGPEEDHATIVTTLLCRALRFVGGASR